MVLLRTGLNSLVPLTLKEKATLVDPVYVIVFVNDTTMQKTACVITDLSTIPDRVQRVNITVKTSPNWLAGEVNLDAFGFFHYYAYEVPTVSVIDYNALIAADIRTYVPTYFTTEVEKGKMKYLTTEVAEKYFKDLATPAKTYNV